MKQIKITSVLCSTVWIVVLLFLPFQAMAIPDGEEFEKVSLQLQWNPSSHGCSGLTT